MILKKKKTKGKGKIALQYLFQRCEARSNIFKILTKNWTPNQNFNIYICPKSGLNVSSTKISPYSGIHNI